MLTEKGVSASCEVSFGGKAEYADVGVEGFGVKGYGGFDVACLDF